jgi:hypothetical protein
MVCYTKPIEEVRTQLEIEVDALTEQQSRTKLVKQEWFVGPLSLTTDVGFPHSNEHVLPQKLLPLASVDGTTTGFALVSHGDLLRETLAAQICHWGL